VQNRRANNVVPLFSLLPVADWHREESTSNENCYVLQAFTESDQAFVDCFGFDFLAAGLLHVWPLQFTF